MLSLCNETQHCPLHHSLSGGPLSLLPPQEGGSCCPDWDTSSLTEAIVVGPIPTTWLLSLTAKWSLQGISGTQGSRWRGPSVPGLSGYLDLVKGLSEEWGPNQAVKPPGPSQN